MRGLRRRSAIVGAVVLLGSILVVSDIEAEVEYRFTAAGDFGARSATDAVLRGVASSAPDAHLALGDLAYGDVTDEYAWCRFVKERVGEGFPFQLLSGNHESLDVADGAINNFGACLPNQIPGVSGTYGREYWMDFPVNAPVVRVIQASPGLTFEDGRWDYSVGDAHHAWLSAAIDEGRALGAKWIVVSAHIPCQSVGKYSCPGAKDFYDLLISKKVDLVLHGHEHSYSRSHQLRSGTSGCATVPVNTFNSTCVADGDSDFAAGAGTVFATVGTGGIPLRSVNGGDAEAGYFAAWSGLDANASYGFLDFTVTESRLTASFVPVAGGSFTDAFTITRGAIPENQPPNAVVETQVRDLGLTVSGASSTDPDGTIESWSWDFGDGATAAGATPGEHVYAKGGTYTVTLVVTDDVGATGSRSVPVTVTDPETPQVLARDRFDRTVAAGWGTAEVGGDWAVNSSSATSVGEGVGWLSTAASSGLSARLGSFSSDDTDLVATLASEKVTTGGGLYVSVAARGISGAGEYRAVVQFRSDGRVGVRIDRSSTTIHPVVIPSGLTYGPGERLKVRVQATGTSPTTVRAKVWRDGSPEPSEWQVSATDTTGQMQAPGWVGFTTYLSRSATNGPISLIVDDVVVTSP